jgi:hypothetical protein
VADLSDVENAVAARILNTLYPNGTAFASVVGNTCRVYRGWPVPAALNSDLAASVVNVTVFPANRPDEVPDAYFDIPYASLPAVTLLATVTGQSVAFSGVVAVNQVVGLLVDGTPYAYNTVNGDTPASIAANLTALIAVNRVAILSTSTITMPDVTALIARVVMNATVTRSLRRQRKEIQVTAWCPSPTLRDSVCGIIDLAFAASSFINLADDTTAHVQYVSTQVYDQSLNALLYRRDLCYKFEYTTVGFSVSPVMLFGDLIDNATTSFL